MSINPRALNKRRKKPVSAVCSMPQMFAHEIWPMIRNFSDFQRKFNYWIQASWHWHWKISKIIWMGFGSMIPYMYIRFGVLRTSRVGSHILINYNWHISDISFCIECLKKIYICRWIQDAGSCNHPLDSSSFFILHDCKQKFSTRSAFFQQKA